MSRRDVVVLGAARSAIGTFGGALAEIEPAELAGTYREPLRVRRAPGVHPSRVADEFGGHVGESTLLIRSSGHCHHSAEHTAGRL